MRDGKRKKDNRKQARVDRGRGWSLDGVGSGATPSGMVVEQRPITVVSSPDSHVETLPPVGGVRRRGL